MALRVSPKTTFRWILPQILRFVTPRRLTSRSSAQRCAATCFLASSVPSRIGVSLLTPKMNFALLPNCHLPTIHSSVEQAPRQNLQLFRAQAHHQRTQRASVTTHTPHTALCFNEPLPSGMYEKYRSLHVRVLPFKEPSRLSAARLRGPSFT